MEIRGPHYSPLPPVSYDPSQRPITRANDNSRHQDQQTGQSARPEQSLTATQQFESDATSNRPKHRFVNRDVELPHEAQQAISSYESADIAGGPELLNRVDVFA